MKSWSWGKFEIIWTVVGPYQTTDEYTMANCSSSIGATPGHKNKLGAAAAARAGVDVTSYDFQIYWQPRCSDAAFGGIAWIGGATVLMNGGSSIDGTAKTLGHELGHTCTPADPPQKVTAACAVFPLR